MKLTVVAGNPKPGSRTLDAARLVAEAVAGREVDEIIDVITLGPGLLGWGDAGVASAVESVRGSDLAVVASPTFKATGTGVLKLFLDQFATGTGLENVVVVPVMLGAGPARACHPTACASRRSARTSGPHRGRRRSVQLGGSARLVKGELAGSPIVGVHSECLTGESFSSQRCECGPQLDAALARVSREGGVVVYLRGHEGRGIGLLEKLAAYRLQDQGFDTMQANLELDELADGREYGGAAAILDDLEVADVRLLTNNPLKVDGLRENGIAVTAVIPLLVGAAPANVRYLEAKRDRMGHLLPGHLEQSM